MVAKPVQSHVNEPPLFMHDTGSHGLDRHASGTVVTERMQGFRHVVYSSCTRLDTGA